jgi:hypothetical protein
MPTPAMFSVCPTTPTSPVSSAFRPQQPMLNNSKLGGVAQTHHVATRLPEHLDTIRAHRAVLWVSMLTITELYLDLLTPPYRAPPVSIDQTVSDFDGVTFHISTPESKSKILISLQIKCFKDLLQYGAQQVLEREYGPYVVAPENGYDFSVQVDLENLPEDKGLEVPNAMWSTC